MYNDKKTGHWCHEYAVDINTRQLTNKVLLSLSYAYNNVSSMRIITM